jgi:hypothetical protein
MLAPLGYWGRAHEAARGISCGAGREEARAFVGPALLVLVGLAGPPAAFGLPAAHWWEWAAAVAGLSIGWWLCGRLAPGPRVQSPPRARSASAP